MDSLNYHAHKMRSRPTPIEKKMWQFLGKKPFGFVFKKQHIIGPYIVDFYCPTLKLAIEVDGKWHQTTTEKDARRGRDLLATHGVKTLRFTGANVFDGSAAKRLKEYLSALKGKTKFHKRKQRSYLYACQIEKRW